MQRLPCRRIQCDEIWSFCYAKRKNTPARFQGQFGVGDVWTWVAFDPDTKLVPCWYLGNRSLQTAKLFMRDLAGRLLHRIQLTTDGYEPYIEAVYDAFGENVDFAMVVKDFVEGTAARAEVVSGDPDPMHMSTSLIERQNLTMRMGMRRYARKTNAFSKKIENHAFHLGLFYMNYNYARPHQSLHGVSPAQAAGIADHMWDVAEIVELLERKERRYGT